MIKSNAFFLLLCFFSISVVSQNFVGKVLYKNSFQSKLPNMTNEKFTALIGSQQVYVIKNGKYLSITNGQLTPVQLYKNSTNKLYTKTGNSDTIICIDASIEKSKIIEIKKEETSIIILGHKCKLLTMKSDNGTLYKYYYSEKLGVNPEDYKYHNYNHWYKYLIETKSLPLKMVIENNQFTMTTEAISFEEKDILDGKFELPSGTILKCN